MSGDPVFVESGRRGARVRWGPPRVVRLDDLTPAQRTLVQTLIREMGSVKEEAADGAQSSAAQTGGRGGRDVPSV
jgi:hypothetical protein